MWEKDEQGPGAAENRPVTPIVTGGAVRAGTVLGPSVVVKGELEATEDLTLEGTVKGALVLRENAVTLGAQGRVEGDVEAREVVVEGRLDGNALVGDRITVSRSGRVQGDLVAPRVVLEDGCTFSGRIDTESAPAASKADEAAQAGA